MSNNFFTISLILAVAFVSVSVKYIDALQRSTLRRKVNREEHSQVPSQLMRWVWAGGRKLKGLIRRRKAESILYKSNLSEISLN